MYYISEKTIVDAIVALRGKVENKFFGLLALLKAISTDRIIPNLTYRLKDGTVANWLDQQFYLADYEGTYGNSNLFVKFSSQWIDYVGDKFINSSIDLTSILAFLYKDESFETQLSSSELLLRFCEDYHLTKDIVEHWFVISDKEILFDTEKVIKANLKVRIAVSNNTISFDKPYSVSARAGELSRAPFLQTLYAGMDSIKCLLLLRENIDEYYGNDIVSEDKHIIRTSVSSSYRPYITAIKSKPFLLLAGISGTGKSRIVRELARACWDVDTPEYKDHKPMNYEMVQVKSNWHDSSELIGYVSRLGDEPAFIAGDFLKFIVKAWENPNVPFFLCLDEMNLAPVEQYFAEYLSVIESRKKDDEGMIVTDAILKKSSEDWYRKLTNELTDDDELRTQFLNDGISIPQNLIVVGTVNMDETTFSFSRKVLDRAMTIEMNKVDLMGGLTDKHENIGKLEYVDLIGDNVEGVDVYKTQQDVCDKAIAYLQNLNNVLEGTPFKVAYRTRNEFLLYVVNNLPYRKDEVGNEISEDEVVARALDEITSMKVLSRIEGDDQKVSKELLAQLKKVVSEMLPENMQEKSVSLAKLKEMEIRQESGFTSFWS